MARKTKQEALATRDGILDAAELLFEKQGVSRTTLQHIAAAAGVSRGAIYWHFDDKSALFNAMMERAKMPLERTLKCGNDADYADPLQDLLDHLINAFQLTVSDPRARRVFEIATHKIEYVDELTGVRDRHLANWRQWLVYSEHLLKLAAERGMISTACQPRVAALGLWAIADGLIRMWLLDPKAFDLVSVGHQAVDTHLQSLKLTGKADMQAPPAVPLPLK
jgi:TetR/AcrR family transcriptional regulator, acrAB operon repressor